VSRVLGGSRPSAPATWPGCGGCSTPIPGWPRPGSAATAPTEPPAACSMWPPTGRATSPAGRPPWPCWSPEVVAPRLGGMRHSAARLGTGSDVLGYDTARSTDHDWGARLAVLVEAGPPEPLSSSTPPTCSASALPCAAGSAGCTTWPPDRACWAGVISRTSQSSSTKGRRPVPPVGDQSTPGTSPRVKRRSETPFEAVSEERSIGSCLSDALRALRRPPMSDEPLSHEEGEHPA
jgi:hypothetical protein